MDQEFYENKRIVAERKAKNELRYKELSRNHLRQSVSKKLKTTMIGALAAFESKFGPLWGHGKRDLSREEIKYKDMWDQVRAEILDRGNSNIRAVEEEISMYDCEWRRYQAEFIITQDQQEK